MATTTKPTPTDKKVSNRQFEDLIGYLSNQGVELTEDIKTGLVQEGIVSSRTRLSLKRGWKFGEDDIVVPSLSFKGLNGRTQNDSMKEFRTKYYELLEEFVPEIDTTSVEN